MKIDTWMSLSLILRVGFSWWNRRK